MSELHDSIAKEFLFEGSPLLLPPLSPRAILSIRAQIGVGIPVPLALAQDLVEEFRKHHQYLQSNRGILAQFSMSNEDLELYRRGFLASLLVIRISCEEEIRPGTRDLLLASLQHYWGYDSDFSSFLEGEIDQCTIIRANRLWTLIFDMCGLHDWSDFYQAGMLASKKAFIAMMEGKIE